MEDNRANLIVAKLKLLVLEVLSSRILDCELNPICGSGSIPKVRFPLLSTDPSTFLTDIATSEAGDACGISVSLAGYDQVRPSYGQTWSFIIDSPMFLPECLLPLLLRSSWLATPRTPDNNTNP